MEMKIILAEEYPLIRAGIKLLIESVEGAEVAGETGDGEACLEMVKDLREKEVRAEKPALLLLITELYLPGKSGFEILKEIERHAGGSGSRFDCLQRHGIFQKGNGYGSGRLSSKGCGTVRIGKGLSDDKRR